MYFQKVSIYTYIVWSKQGFSISDFLLLFHFLRRRQSVPKCTFLLRHHPLPGKWQLYGTGFSYLLQKLRFHSTPQLRLRNITPQKTFTWALCENITNYQQDVEINHSNRSKSKSFAKGTQNQIFLVMNASFCLNFLNPSEQTYDLTKAMALMCQQI